MTSGQSDAFYGVECSHLYCVTCQAVTRSSHGSCEICGTRRQRNVVTETYRRTVQGMVGKVNTVILDCDNFGCKECACCGGTCVPLGDMYWRCDWCGKVRT